MKRRGPGCPSGCATRTAICRDADAYDVIGDASTRSKRRVPEEERNRLFYLAIPPSVFETTIEHCRRSGLAPKTPMPSERPWARVVIEKPFGRSLETAQRAELRRARQVRRAPGLSHRSLPRQGKRSEHSRFPFCESDVRAALEPAVHQQVQITVAETVGVETRGKYYEEAGIIRDMFQNHLLQLLALAAMEPPIAFNGRRSSRRKSESAAIAVDRWSGRRILRSCSGSTPLRNSDGKHVPGYREEKDVDPHSHTPTFAAMRFDIDNWRWRHVPFYLRSGKRLAESERPRSRFSSVRRRC